MEAQESARSNEGALGLAQAAHSAVKSGLSSVVNAVTRDGTLAAAWRQGADEVGMALKAFPESIQVEEPGTILNPTQGEIASARNHDPSPSSAPSTIAKSAAKDGYVEGRGLILDSSSPSPSAIAKEGSNHQATSVGQAQSSPSEIARNQGAILDQEKTWAQREDDRRAQGGNADNDQNERAKGRNLPEEQREKERDLGPSRCR